MSYDGRVSEACKDECQQGTCVKTWGDPYGCGGCCACTGGCYVGAMEQLDEEQSGSVEGGGSTPTPPRGAG